MDALFVAADGFDDRELLYVAQRLREEDVEVVKARDVGDGTKTTLDDGYDLVHVTGGERGEKERARVGDTVRHGTEDGALVTAVGEGVEVLVEAGVAGDRQVAARGDTAEKVRAVDGRAYDEPVVVDAKMLTTVGGDALAEFGAEVVRKVRRARLKDL